jgi:serine palmitoyltransferase
VLGLTLRLFDRVSRDNKETFGLTGTTTVALNLASYNYLGFAGAHGLRADRVEAVLRTHLVASCSLYEERETKNLHIKLGALTAWFVAKSSSIVF